jgi:hypothetical protein
VSKLAALLLALLLTHRAKRSIPALLSLGPSGLTESLSGMTLAEVKRAIAELTRHRLVITDFNVRPPLIYCIGAVKTDPPTTVNAVRGMAIQHGELPLSPVTAHVHAEITDALQGSEWLPKWHEWTAGTIPTSSPDPRPDPRPESGPESGPLRDPIPIPRSDPATAALYQRAWDRVRGRVFAAAAAAEIDEAVRTWDEETFCKLTVALFESKWLSERMNIPPTLRRLLDDQAYTAKVIAGTYRDPQRTWQCPDCKLGHSPLDGCPPKCRACLTGHSPGYVCRRLQDLEEREQIELDEKTWRSIDGETFQQLVERHGIRRAFEIKREQRENQLVTANEGRL